MLLVATSTATAAPPWSAPRDASPSAGFLTTPGLAFARDGSALLGWDVGRRGRVATLRADGAIVQSGRLGHELVAKPLLVSGDRTALLTGGADHEA